MSTAVMTRRAFDTRGNLADQLFRCLETPYSDVLEHNTVSPTMSEAVSEIRKPPFSCPMWRFRLIICLLIDLLLAKRGGTWGTNMFITHFRSSTEISLPRPHAWLNSVPMSDELCDS